MPKKPLSGALKVFYGIGDFGFNLMSSVEIYYFVFSLTNFAMFDAATAALVSGIGSLVDAILGWMYGGFINSLKPMRWGRYRSWLLVLPWVVPILYCFEFTRLSENTIVAAVLIIFFNVTSHMAWDFPYVSNICTINMATDNPQERAHRASTRGMGSNGSKIFFGYLMTGLLPVGAALFGYGVTHSSSTAMYTDTVVYNEWKNHNNAAGWINGLQLFPLKIGFMARGIMIPFVLAAVGFTTAENMAPFLEPGAQLTQEFLSFQHGIGIGFMIIPACLCLAGAVLLLAGYKLTPAKLAQYQKEIDERKAEEGKIQS